MNPLLRLCFGLILYFVVCPSLTAQEGNFSIEAEKQLVKIKEELDPREKVELLLSYAESLAEKGYFELSNDYAIEALAIAKKSDSQSLGNVYRTFGKINFFKGDKSASLEYYLKAENLLKSNKDDVGLAGCYNDMASIYFSIGQFETSIEILKKALKINYKLGDIENIADNYANIGFVYEEFNTQKAIAFYKRSLSLYGEIGRSEFQIKPSLQLYGSYLKIGDLKNAEYYLNNTLRLAEKKQSSLHEVYLEIGALLIDVDSVKSKFYLEKALTNAEKADDKVTQIKCYISLGDLTSQFNLDKAISFYEKSLEIAKSIGYIELIKESALVLKMAYLKKNDFKLAYKMTNLISFQDSILNSKKIDEIELLNKLQMNTAEMNLVKLDKNLLEKEKYEILIISISAIIVLVSLSILFFYRYRIKNLKYLSEVLNQEVEQKTIRLKKANQIQSILNRILVHDLKSPMIFLSSVAKRITKNSSILSQDEIQELSAEIENLCDSLVLFIEEYVIWSEAKEKDFKPKYERIQISELIEPISNLYGKISKQHKNTIQLNLQDFFIETDGSLLQIIIRNLIDNANKNTYNGSIEVKSFIDNKGCNVISITDTGNGMTKEMIHNLYNLNLDENIVSNTNNGTKLGYYIIMEFVKILGMRIEISSEGWNKGTSIMLCLPNLKSGKLLSIKIENEN